MENTEAFLLKRARTWTSGIVSSPGEPDQKQSLRTTVFKHSCKRHADYLAYPKLNETYKTKRYII